MGADICGCIDFMVRLCEKECCQLNVPKTLDIQDDEYNSSSDPILTNETFVKNTTVLLISKSVNFYFSFLFIIILSSQYFSYLSPFYQLRCYNSRSVRSFDSSICI